MFDVRGCRNQACKKWLQCFSGECFTKHLYQLCYESKFYRTRREKQHERKFAFVMIRLGSGSSDTAISLSVAGLGKTRFLRPIN